MNIMSMVNKIHESEGCAETMNIIFVFKRSYQLEASSYLILSPRANLLYSLGSRRNMYRRIFVRSAFPCDGKVPNVEC